MQEPINPVFSLSNQERIEQEMLHAVLINETAFPWNPSDPKTSAYLDSLEAALEPGDLPEDIFVSQWGRLSQQAEQLWPSAENFLTAALIQRFEPRVPTPLLSQIAASAKAASDSSQALIDQLVSCVQDVLQGWDPDDLRVMARPLAMAMRDGQGEVLDVTLRSVRQTEWENLSEMEQVRLSLAIARYALGEIVAAEEES